MSERDRHERRAAEKLLAFRANGSLDEEEAAGLERALEEDAELREELLFLDALREGVKASTEVPSAGDLGWARLQKTIRQEERRGLVARVWKPALALAAGLALLVQGAAIFQLQDDRAALAGRSDAQVQITFAPDAREADLRALLQEVGATIVDGPGASGVYRLQIDPAPETPEAWRALVDGLAARGDLVTYADLEE